MLSQAAGWSDTNGTPFEVGVLVMVSTAVEALKPLLVVSILVKGPGRALVFLMRVFLERRRTRLNKAISSFL